MIDWKAERKRRKVRERYHTVGDTYKHQLANLVKDLTDTNQPTSRKIVETIFRSITNALHEGEQVRIVGFGLFYPRRRKGYLTGGANKGWRIPPKIIVRFRAGPELKRML